MEIVGRVGAKAEFGAKVRRQEPEPGEGAGSIVAAG